MNITFETCLINQTACGDLENYSAGFISSGGMQYISLGFPVWNIALLYSIQHNVMHKAILHWPLEVLAYIIFNLKCLTLLQFGYFCTLQSTLHKRFLLFWWKFALWQNTSTQTGCSSKSWLPESRFTRHASWSVLAEGACNFRLKPELEHDLNDQWIDSTSHLLLPDRVTLSCFKWKVLLWKN